VSDSIPASDPSRAQRPLDALRPVTLERGAIPHAEGSCLVSFGQTRVLCAASIEEGVPGWRRGRGLGWLTAEYAMLPRATRTRTSRERSQVGGRTQEIQRLIGRSLRAVVNMNKLGERTIWVDCDVIQADGGTRTAAITGAFVAMVLAMQHMVDAKMIQAIPVRDYLAATSVGVVDGVPMLDLAYEEDSRADVDMNVIRTGDGRFIEVQGTAEKDPFPRATLDRLLDLASAGIDELIAKQREIVGELVKLPVPTR
jgi:ribonuclease PH